MFRLYKATIFTILFFSSFLCQAQQDEILSKVSKTKVKTGEVFSYTIRIEGKFSSPKLIAPEFTDFKVIGESQTQNYSFAAGKPLLLLTLSYELLATKPGVFSLEGATIKDKDRTLKSEPQSIEVVGQALQDKKIRPPIGKGIDI